MPRWAVFMLVARVATVVVYRAMVLVGRPIQFGARAAMVHTTVLGSVLFCQPGTFIPIS